MVTLYHIISIFAGTQFTASAPVSPRSAVTSKLQVSSCSSGLTKRPLALRELGCWELLFQKLSLSTLICRMSIRTIISNVHPSSNNKYLIVYYYRYFPFSLLSFIHTRLNIVTRLVNFIIILIAGVIIAKLIYSSYSDYSHNIMLLP